MTTLVPPPKQVEALFGKLSAEWRQDTFSMSPSKVEMVRAYIENQEGHHKVRTFPDEFRELLRRHEIEWDKRYVWD